MDDLASPIRGIACAPTPCPLEDLAGYVVPRYSKSQVVAAGKVIASKNPYPGDRSAQDEMAAAFRLAHDWRGAHIRPMRLVRNELSRMARALESEAIVAARLKRMQSIRKKMQRRPMTLFQMQDIAGARAIVSEMRQVDGLLDFYRSGKSKFEVQREWDYISDPKEGGYRSCHLRLICKSETVDEAYEHMAVEVQVRTELQHAWATAVEAVGLVNRQELKSGDGDPKWLRLFELMASEIAEIEGHPLVPGTPLLRRERMGELRDLVARLDAVTTLENYAKIIRATEGAYSEPGALYVIRYDYVTGDVAVSAYSRFSWMYERFREMEAEELGGKTSNTVSVEVDRVQDLRRAYPNYFLDVRLFNKLLKQAIGGVAGPLPAARAEAEKPRKFKHDLSWLQNYPFNRRKP